MIEGDINDFIRLPVVYLTKDGLLEIERLHGCKEDLQQYKIKLNDPDKDPYLPVDEPELEFNSFTEIEDAINRIYTATEYSRHINKSVRLRDIADYEPSDYASDMSVVSMYNRTGYTINMSYDELDKLIAERYGNS